MNQILLMLFKTYILIHFIFNYGLKQLLLFVLIKLISSIICEKHNDELYKFLSFSLDNKVNNIVFAEVCRYVFLTSLFTICLCNSTCKYIVVACNDCLYKNKYIHAYIYYTYFKKIIIIILLNCIH